MHKTRGTLVFLSLMLCISGVAYSASYYCGSCADCTSKIGSASSGDVVYLNADISSAGTCLSFYQVQGISLDCLGHSVIGSGSGYGIHVTRGGSNVFHNCVISSYDSAVFFFMSGDNVFTDNVLRNNKGYGIHMTLSGSNTFSGNIIESNGGAGIYVLSSSSDNRFTGNRVNNNGGFGLHLTEAGSNSFTGNQFMNNQGGAGVYIHDSAGSNQFTLNNITGNQGYGVHITVSTRADVFSQNDLSGNGGSGIYIHSSSGINRFVNNRVDHNGMYGLHLTLSGSNIFENNTFNLNSAGSGVYIHKSAGGNKFLKIESEHNGDYGVHITKSGGSDLFTNCRFSDNGLSGIYIHSSSGSNQFTNCLADGNAGYGVHVTLSRNNVFSECSFSRNSGGSGIYMHSSDGGNQFSNIDSNNNGGYGVHITDSGGSDTFSNCRFSDNGASGVYIYRSSGNNRFTDSSIDRNGNYGVLLTQSGGNYFFCDTINQNEGGSGIYIYSSSASNTFNGNQINKNGGYGIHITESASNAITSNLINDNGASGIYIYETDGMRIENNQINNNAGYGIHVTKSGKAVVSCNTITSSSSTGIYIYSSSQSMQISNNVINNNKGYGLRVTAAEAGTVSGNVISSNSNTGLYIYRCDSGCTLSDNRISSNGGNYGVQFTSFEGSIGQNCVCGHKTDFYIYRGDDGMSDTCDHTQRWSDKGFTACSAGCSGPCPATIGGTCTYTLPSCMRATTTTTSTTTTTTSSTTLLPPSVSTTTTIPPAAITTTTTTTSTTTTLTAVPGTKTVTLRYKLTYNEDPDALFNCSIWTNVSGEPMSVTAVQNNTLPSEYQKTYRLLKVPTGWYRWTVNCSDGAHNVYPNATEAPRGAPKGYWLFYVNVTTTSTTTTTTTTSTLVWADLIVPDIWYLGNTIYYNLSNMGGTGASATHSSLAIDGSFIKDQTSPAIHSGMSRQESFAYAYTCSGVSDLIRVCADSGHVIPESDESNNCRNETWNCPTTTTTTTTTTTIPPLIPGNSDVVLVTDLSGTMMYCLDGSNAGCSPTGCPNSPPHANGCTPVGGNNPIRYELAKSLNSDFVDRILSRTNNRVALVAYGKYVGSSAPYLTGLSSDPTYLKTQINKYTAYNSALGGATCVCCAIRRARQVLASGSAAGRNKYILLMSDGVANRKCNDPYPDMAPDGSTWCCGSYGDIEPSCSSRASIDSCSSPSGWYIRNCMGTVDFTGISQARNDACNANTALGGVKIYTIGMLSQGVVSGCSYASKSLRDIAGCGSGQAFIGSSASELAGIYKKF